MVMGLGPGEILLSLFLLTVPALAVLIPAWRIVSRVGHHGAWSLLLLIPLVNIAAFIAFAYAAWPAERAWDAGPGAAHERTRG